jgi:hypothetical protein
MPSKIAIIIPYFGKWPEWINLFLYSCGQNWSVDFIIFTDCDVTLYKPVNVHFYSVSFEEYCTYVGKLLNIDFHPKQSYKLCDLRPFFSFIHKDLLVNYDFWGFGDIDVVWGKINDFYTETLLNKFDVFSTHNDRLSGHLSFFRNDEKFRNLCFQIKNWKFKLSADINYGLDEVDFSWLIFPESKWIGKFYRQIMMKFLGWKIAWESYYSIFPLIHFVLGFKRRRLYFKEQHTTPILNSDGRLYKYESDVWYYNEGRIYNDRVDKNYIYLHFMIYKKNNIKNEFYWKERFYSIAPNYNFADGVIIDKNGISMIQK